MSTATRNQYLLCPLICRLVLTLLVTLIVPIVARADRIDKELLALTMPLLDHLKANKAKTVGVLKFRARRDGGKEDFHLGPINNILADRLENTLLLGYDASEAPIDVIHDASSVAASHHLSYLPATSAARLFELKYPLAAGGKLVTPDIFLTGLIDFDSKNHTTTVVIQSLTKDKPALQEVAKFTVPTERSTLAEAGRSFIIKRSLAEKDAAPEKEEADVAAETDAVGRQKAAEASVKNQPKPPSGEGEASPIVPAAAASERLVDMQVRYNNQPVSLIPDARNPANQAFTRDPKEGDAVTFVLKNRSEGKDATRVAVALLVNGINTVKEEMDDPCYCTKWILEPGKELVVDGFYIKESGPNNVKPFKVLSDEESDALFSRNPGDLSNEKLGTISIHVFVESKFPTTADTPVVTRGLAPSKLKKEAANLKSAADLRKLLLSSADGGKQTRLLNNRGLIASDGKVQDGSRLVQQQFDNPMEVEHFLIRYYQPGPK